MKKLFSVYDLDNDNYVYESINYEEIEAYICTHFGDFDIIENLEEFC